MPRSGDEFKSSPGFDLRTSTLPQLRFLIYTIFGLLGILYLKKKQIRGKEKDLT